MRFGYARISSADQNLERQIEAFEEYNLDEVVTEVISTREEVLPCRDALIGRLQEGDLLYVKELTRLGRSTLDVLAVVQRIRDAKAGLRTLDGALTLDPNPSAVQVAVLGILTVVAQLERDLARERQLEGIAIAKRRGTYKGRQRRLAGVDDAALVSLIQSVGKRKAASTLGVARSTLNRALKRRKL